MPFAKISPLLLAALCSATACYADTITTSQVTVNASAVIYSVGVNSGLAAGIGGTAPVSIALTPSTTYFTFSVGAINGIPQTITVNGGTLNGADGNGAAVSTSSNVGTNNLSGISGPGAGYLTGVFVNSTVSGAVPGTINFASNAFGSSFSSLNPQLNQVFYIGDGLTGTGSGSTQSFFAPVGATTLYLGIVDSVGYNGTPGAYGDNFGAFQVTANDFSNPVTAATPEPSSLLLAGTGALGIIGSLRRRLFA